VGGTGPPEIKVEGLGHAASPVPPSMHTG